MPDGDSSPCIDGLKIFPEVQERYREDGFTEYLVSAYGRINSIGFFRKTKSYKTYGVHFSISEPECPGGYNSSSYSAAQFSGFLDKATQIYVIPASTGPVLLQPPPGTIRFTDSSTGENILEKNFTPQQLAPTLFLEGTWQGDFSSRKPTLTILVENVEYNNYGSFDEYQITWSVPSTATGLGYANSSFTRDQYLPPCDPSITFSEVGPSAFTLTIEPGQFTDSTLVSISTSENFNDFITDIDGNRWEDVSTFFAYLQGLTGDTIYFVRVIAKNSFGDTIIKSQVTTQPTN